LLYKYIFFQKYDEQKFNLLEKFLFLRNLTYLNLVVFPQGVRGYLTDFVRPPCG
jgi:hypothetical protein